tara:strand:+ start:1991 stop:2332 length:342 start_codon:yes stop_codon:yes gene_type:complete
MAKLLSNETASELPAIFEAVRNLTANTRVLPRRRIRSLGGGGSGSRAYVVITAVTDAANYVGDVITGPDDATIITGGVAIKVKGATANAFEVGYPNFADVVGDVYYLDGSVLG